MNSSVYRSFHSKSYFALLIIYRLTLDIAYITFVSKFYKYAGFDLNLVFSSYLLSWVLYLFSFLFVDSKLKKISDLFFHIAFLAIIAPLTSLYGLDDRDTYPVLVTIFSFLLIFSIAKINFKIDYSPILIKNGSQLAFFISLIFVMASLIWIIASGAISNLNLDLTRVYEFRGDNTEVLNIGFGGYLNSWVTKVFNLVLIIFFLRSKKFIMAAIFIGLQVLFFSVLSVKSILFYPLLILVIWYYLRYSNSAIILPLLLIAILLISLLLYFITNDLLIPSWFIRRVFYVPSNLTFIYFEFFSNNQNIYWSDSILSSFLTYPYSENIAKVIGSYMGTGSHANNGFISTGYAHAGIYGVIFYSVLLGFLLKFIDSLQYTNLNLWIGVSLTIIPFRSVLISSDFFTSMLTHGLIIAVIILMLIRKRGTQN
jgi:hypothetical protein